MKSHTHFDWQRQDRTGLPEVVFSENKSVAQLRDIIEAHQATQSPLLMTRLTEVQMHALSDVPVHIDRIARTATLAAAPLPKDAPRLAIVSAGTSDLPIAQEALVTAHFLGLNAHHFPDLGVAGLWRLQEALDDLRKYPLVLAVAGMEGALFSVLAGLISAPVIAVPTSVGYGVATGGQAALSSALASCAPGITVVNIDNGFGAAAAARKILSIGTEPG